MWGTRGRMEQKETWPEQLSGIRPRYIRPTPCYGLPLNPCVLAHKLEATHDHVNDAFRLSRFRPRHRPRRHGRETGWKL